MSVAPAERTGLLVIRAWLETNGEPRLRARISHSVDLERREETSTAVATREEISAVVENWLDDLLR